MKNLFNPLLASNIQKIPDNLTDITTRQHSDLTGLTADDHTQYALLVGRTGGQTFSGGTDSGNNLTIQSSSHATKGKIIFGTSAYDEVNNRLGVGTVTPTTQVHFSKSQNTNTEILVENTSTGSLASTAFTCRNDTGDIGSLGGFSSLYSAAHFANHMVLLSSSTFGAGFDIVAQKAADTIKFYAGGTSTAKEQLRVVDGVVTVLNKLGIGTFSPAVGIDNRLSMRTGDGTNYAQMDGDGDLTFVGTADYLVAGNKYAFRYSAGEDIGLYFNGTTGMFQFLGTTAVSVLNISATAGGGIDVPGALRVGDNLYAFKSSTDTDAGVKFNATDTSIDFMSTTAVDNAKVWIETGITRKGGKRVSTQFDKIDATIASSGLTQILVAGKTYAFKATLFVDASALGGSKYTIATINTLTATNIIYNVNLLDNTTNAYTITSRQTTLGGTAGQAGTTAGLCIIEGTITVGVAGTLAVGFAQNTADGTSSVLVGSNLIIEEIV